MYFNDDDHEAADTLRRIISKELDEDLESLDMESEYRNPVHFSLFDIVRYPTKLRYIRRHLTRANLLALSVHELKMLTEREGFLDTRVPPAVAARMLQFDPTSYSTTAPVQPAVTDAFQSLSHLDDVKHSKIVSDDAQKPRSPPTVSRARLDAWWEEYRTTRKVELVSEADVLKAARTAIPDHHIPRQMIRERLGSRKRGPKPRVD